ncbi:class I SAM-dependent methyltransferase [Paludisphaera sp.]|uniref:class I SAM-dependent methyltransferase n=1 Tax=Paludisphaera sp. TaxID=2017432 RepID=UPI00301D6905
MIDAAGIGDVRRELERIGCLSSTSPSFQNQLLSYLDMNADRGDFLVEVGCFRGGLTAQLAYFAREAGKDLFVVDVDPKYLNMARETVTRALGGLPSCVHFVQADLRNFLARPRPSDRCVLLFIDGDHHYDGVVRDIRAVLDSGLERPLSICFHDYGLRYTARDHLDVRVDRAIHDLLGDHAVIPIGEVAGFSGVMPTEPVVADSGAHFESGASEGVVVVLPAAQTVARRVDRPEGGRVRRLLRSTLPAGVRRTLRSALAGPRR